MLRDKVDENPIDFVSVPKSGPTNEDLAIYIEQLKSSKNTAPERNGNSIKKVVKN